MTKLMNVFTIIMLMNRSMIFSIRLGITTNLTNYIVFIIRDFGIQSHDLDRMLYFKFLEGI